MDAAIQLSRSQDICARVARILTRRAEGAHKLLGERVRHALAADTRATAAPNGHLMRPAPWDNWIYATDVAQRSILFWNTLRQRGTEYVERASQEARPVLHFDYELILDGRRFARPVNYALLKVKAPHSRRAGAHCER